MLTSFSSSSHHFYPSLYLFVSYVFYKIFHTQDTNNNNNNNNNKLGKREVKGL